MINWLTALLVIITGFYAWVTYRILKTNERLVEVMHEQADVILRPYISISPILEPDNPIFYLRITNTGKTSAQNLKLSLDKSIYQFGEKKEDSNLAFYPAFKETIVSFPPGAQIVFSLAQSFSIFGKNVEEGVLPKTFTVFAEYSYGNKTIKENNFIDLHPYLNSNIPQDPYVRKLNELTEAICKIQRTLEKLCTKP